MLKQLVKKLFINNGCVFVQLERLATLSLKELIVQPAILVEATETFELNNGEQRAAPHSRLRLRRNGW